MDKVLVVGGAGYIGSHTCLDLAERGFEPVVYDNLSNGHSDFVKWGPLEIGDIRDRTCLDAVIAAHNPVAIVHFAALIEVGQSVIEPLRFYENNVSGTITLLAAAEAAGIDKFVFSSTCATYGEPQSLPMTETHPQVPISPYGRTKYLVEEILRDLANLKRFRHAILRYFNASGADPQARIGEWHTPETHAIPLAVSAAMGRRDGFTIFGSDYDTRDGTCVRDYVHVMDLADAHGRAVEYLLAGNESVALNLGTGTGTTVAEMLAAIENTSGRPFPTRYADRRPGDSPSLVADNRKAFDVIGWSPKRKLDEIIQSAWNWHTRLNTTN